MAKKPPNPKDTATPHAGSSAPGRGGSVNVDWLEVREVADMFSAVADFNRLRLLYLLAERGDRNVNELAATLGALQPTMSYNLSVLARVGLVNGLRRGHNVLYSLSPRITVQRSRGIQMQLSGGGSITISRH